MRQASVIALAIVTIPVALLALFLPSGTDSGAPAAKPTALFPTLQGGISSAEKLTVTGPDATVIVERKPAADAQKPATPGPQAAVPADGWTLPDKGGYPVQPGTIRPILAGLVNLHTVEATTARPKLYGRLDLGDPGKGSEAHEVTLADAAGHALATLIVGKRADDPLGKGNDGLYVRKPDQPQTWLARPPFSLPTTELDWIDRKIVDIDAETVKDIRLTPADSKPLEFSRDKPADKLVIKDLPKDTKLKSDNPGSDVAAGFRYLDLDDVKPMAQLTGKPAATAELQTFDGLTVDLTLTKQGDSTWATVAATGTDKAAKAADEITARTKGWAYKLADGRAATLEDKLSDLVQAPEPAPTPGESKAPKPPLRLPH